MIAVDWTPERCRQRYKKRFGVETSYRLGNKQLGWTCPSRKSHPALKELQLERSSVILLHRPAHPYSDGLLHIYGPHLRSLCAHPEPHRVPNSARYRESRHASATGPTQPE